MNIQIHLDNSGPPIYAQIVSQIKYLVASGRLEAGAELPPIRTLAEKLVINPNTVARAYRELEVEGIVEKRRTAGTYISDSGPRWDRRERMRILTERIDALLTEARQLNVATDDVIELIQEREGIIFAPLEARS